MEKTLSENIGNTKILKQAKIIGFSDKYISILWNMKETEIYSLRKKENIIPIFFLIFVEALNKTLVIIITQAQSNGPLDP